MEPDETVNDEGGPDIPGEVAVHIVHEPGGASPVARVRGEIDLANADHVRRRLAAAVTPSDAGLVVDLGETTYLDSAAIRMLGQLVDELRARRQDVVVVAPPGSRAERLFAVAMVDGVLRVAPDVRSALVQLDAPR